MASTVFLVDDEQSIRSSIQNLLEDEGYRVETAESGETFMAALEDVQPDAVLLDIWLPGMDGLEVLKLLKKTHTELPVIMLSGHGNIETAVTATKYGAYHFIEKPFAADALLLTLRHALKEVRLVKENTQLKVAVGRNQHSILGQSTPFLELMEQVERVAVADASVLIHGENGTGKESVANMVHEKSPRAQGPFVEVNCAAIPEELIESELFGHEKGSFTGANARKIGKFDQAHRGTLFLDEIGDMSLKTQAKILRVLQEQRFERVGGHQEIQVDVRVVAASNKRLEDEISVGNFREDLYYRLNVLPLEVPPLRERRGDVRLLVPFFLEYFAHSYGRKPPGVSIEAMAVLERYQWPGNIRELKNIVERMVIMSRKPTLEKQDIPPAVLNAVEGVGAGAVASGGPHSNLVALDIPFKEAKDRFEKAYLEAQLKHHDWNISRTAEAIGLERSNLHKKIKQYQLQQP